MLHRVQVYHGPWPPTRDGAHGIAVDGALRVLCVYRMNAQGKVLKLAK
jgi:hypothetical protein